MYENIGLFFMDDVVCMFSSAYSFHSSTVRAVAKMVANTKDEWEGLKGTNSGRMCVARSMSGWTGVIW